MMVMEYLSRRDLRALLIKANVPFSYVNTTSPADAHITDSKLLQFVDQIVDGMVYLSEKRVKFTLVSLRGLP